MTPDRIFRLRYEKIREAVANPRNEALLLDLPFALRQLLIDGTPLVHQVNRERKLKLTFSLGQSARQSMQELMALGVPEPDIYVFTMFAVNAAMSEVNLDGLLAFEVVKLNTAYYTARELIDACANKLGSVHFDPKGTDHAVVRDLRELGEWLARFGLGSAFSVILVIARVALDGLRPLYESIERR